MLCSINSAINPFITFRRTFSQIYQQFRAKQKQRQLRERLNKNHFKLNAGVPPGERKPKPSLVETLNLTPIVQVIEIIQQHGKDDENRDTDNTVYVEEDENENYQNNQMNVSYSDQSEHSHKFKSNNKNSKKSKTRRRKTSRTGNEGMISPPDIVMAHDPESIKSCTSLRISYSSPELRRAHISKYVISSSSDAEHSDDPVALYMAENSSVFEPPTPPDIDTSPPINGAIQIFPPNSGTVVDHSNHSQSMGESNKNDSNSEQKLAPSSSAYTHNLTKQMLMKYTPEKFDKE